MQILEKYNREIQKIIKLFIMLISSYFIVYTTAPDMSYKDIGRIIIMVTFVFMIIDTYYPSVDYE
jgi:hypothetical protein